MNRMATVMTALCLALSLAGCGKTGGSTNDGPNTADQPSVSEPAGGLEEQTAQAQNNPEEQTTQAQNEGTAQSNEEQQDDDAPEMAPAEELFAETPAQNGQVELQEEEYAVPSDSDITGAIIAENHEYYPDAEFEAASYVVYATGGSADDSSIFIVYLMALYQGYDFPDGKPETVGAVSGPAALTFRQSGDAFQLIDYWTPDDGGEYLSSLRETFPSTIPEEDLDTQKYIQRLMADCNAQAEAYAQTR